MVVHFPIRPMCLIVSAVAPEPDAIRKSEGIVVRCWR